jgi:hypothetical protein
VTGADVRAAARSASEALAPHVGRDWSSIPVPGLELTVAAVVAHVAEVLTWYALDLAAGRRQLDVVRPKADALARPSDLLVAVEATAELVAGVVDAAAPDVRGFHPYGWADAAGFAAMACDEVLVHADDACRGLGVELLPPPGLPDVVLARLFPDVVAGPDEDAWSLLRWSNDRLALPGRGRLGEGWRWHAAPLDERAP